MSRLSPSAYLQHLRADSARFRDVLADCDPGARVPSCPDWDAEDLLWHLACVQHFWRHVIRTRPADPESSGYAEPVRPDRREGLLDFFATTHAGFSADLAEADPAEPAWSWSDDPADHTVGFTYRRQAHEALIHRRDAELAAGDLTPFDPALAADGVAEVFSVMYGGTPPWGRFDPLPTHVELRLEDVGESVWVQLGLFSGTSPEGRAYAGEKDLRTVADPGVPAAVVIAGSAEQTDAWLWHRAADEGITVAGDRAAYAHLREVVEQPIN